MGTRPFCQLHVHVADEAQQHLTVAATHGLWRDHPERKLLLGEGLAGQVAQSGQPLRVNDYTRWAERSLEREEPGFTRVLSVPLLAQDRVVGVLNIEDDDQRDDFSKADETLLMRLASLAALAIERARLYSQTEAQLADMKRAHQEISALQDLTAVVQSSLALPEVLNRIAEGVMQGLGYRAVMVAVYDAPIWQDHQRHFDTIVLNAGFELVEFGLAQWRDKVLYLSPRFDVHINSTCTYCEGIGPLGGCCGHNACPVQCRASGDGSYRHRQRSKAPAVCCRRFWQTTHRRPLR